MEDATQARQIELPGSRLGETPADALAQTAKAERGSVGIVDLEALEVAAGGSHVERPAAAVDMVGTFEAAHPERVENA